MLPTHTAQVPTLCDQFNYSPLAIKRDKIKTTWTRREVDHNPPFISELNQSCQRNELELYGTKQLPITGRNYPFLLRVCKHLLVK